MLEKFRADSGVMLSPHDSSSISTATDETKAIFDSDPGLVEMLEALELDSSTGSSKGGGAHHNKFASLWADMKARAIENSKCQSVDVPKVDKLLPVMSRSDTAPAERMKGANSIDKWKELIQSKTMLFRNSTRLNMVSTIDFDRVHFISNSSIR